MAEFGQPANGDADSEGLSGDAGRDDWNDAFARELLHESLSQAGFIDYNGGIKVHKSLLNVVLHD